MTTKKSSSCLLAAKLSWMNTKPLLRRKPKVCSQHGNSTQHERKTDRSFLYHHFSSHTPKRLPLSSHQQLPPLLPLPVEPTTTILTLTTLTTTMKWNKKTCLSNRMIVLNFVISNGVALDGEDACRNPPGMEIGNAKDGELTFKNQQQQQQHMHLHGRC